LTRADAEEALQRAGVIHGVRVDMIEKFLALPGGGEAIVVAEGTPALQGQDGWVEVVPRKGESGIPGGEAASRPDLRFINAFKGEVVARIHPPSPGTPGRSVTGDVLSPSPGKGAVLLLGTNVRVSEIDPSTIMATENGAAVARPDGMIDIQRTVDIRGNVDLATGNVDFAGSLIIHGDVMSDFTVKAGESIQIHGNVEDACVEAGGDVTVAKAFVGRGKGKIVTGGNVSVHHVLNQTVVAGRDVLIEKECINGTISVGMNLRAPRATIAGGLIDAMFEVELDNLGSSDGSHAFIRVGKRGRLLERMSILERDLKASEKQHLEVKEAVYKLIKLKIDVGALPLDKEALLQKLQQAQKLLPGRLEALRIEKTQVVEELQKNVDARITVHGTVYENVVVEVNGVKKMVDHAVQDIVFVERAGAVDIRSN
jgi:hypothetical protein